MLPEFSRQTIKECEVFRGKEYYNIQNYNSLISTAIVNNGSYSPIWHNKIKNRRK